MELFSTTNLRPEAGGGMKESFKTDKKRALSIREAEAAIKWPLNYHTAAKVSDLGEIARLISETGEFIFDLETSGTHAWKDKAYSCGIYVAGQAFSIPFEHRMQPTIPVEAFKSILGEFFLDPDVKRTNHYIKFDAHFVEERLGVPVGRLYCDTHLQAWLVDPLSDHGLKELAQHYGFEQYGRNYTGQFGKTAWAYLSPKLANYYLCKDVELVAKVHGALNDRMESKPKLKSLFWDVEMPTLNICYELEREGMIVDQDYFFNDLTPKIYAQYDSAVEALRPLIEPHLGLLEKQMTISEVLESPTASSKIFFEGIGTPLIKNVTLGRGDGGGYTKTKLDKDAIASLKATRVEMRLLGDYRKVATVKKLFIDKLPPLMVDGKLYPTVNPTGTNTGRMTMNDPNLQQIPSRMGPIVRNAFVPKPGHVFMSADFSQQEMRIMAHFSNDPGLIDIFTKSKFDMYSQMAIDVFGCDPSEFADKNKAKKHPQRDRTKVTVLGTGYGMGIAKLARSLGVKFAEAARIVELYFGRYPGIISYQKRAIEFVEEHGYIVSLLGRERPIPNIHSGEPGKRAAAERELGNMPIQGTAADQCKLAGIAAYTLIHENNWPIRLALYIHDEIIFEIEQNWAKSHPNEIQQILRVMEGVIPLRVPVVVNAVFESRWGSEMNLDDLDDIEELDYQLEAA